MMTKKAWKPKVEMRDPNSLIPYENNARDNTEAIPIVESSIAEFDFISPIIVDCDNVIIGGHTRVEAAKRLGLTEVPVIVASHLTKDQADAFRLVDNKSAEKAGWIFDLLDAETDRLGDKFDFTSFGFTFDILPEDLDFSLPDDDEGSDDAQVVEEYEVPQNASVAPSNHSADLGDLELPEVVVELEDDPDDTIPDELPSESITKKGDLLIMGRHRVYCGDSTDLDSFGAVMQGDVADIAFTSPPYNAGYVGREGKPKEGKKYINDEDRRSDEEYTEFLCTVLGNMLDNCEEVFYNIGMVSGSKKATITMCERYKDNFKDMVYWFKTNPVPSIAKGVISSGVEPIYAFGRNPSRAFKKEIGIFNGVINCPANTHNEFAAIHKAVFPYQLPIQLISRFTEEGGIVLDPFGGMGTTLIACEELGRTARLIELEPIYCDQIARRYMTKTGGTVLIQRDGQVFPFRTD